MDEVRVNFVFFLVFLHDLSYAGEGGLVEDGSGVDLVADEVDLLVVGEG